MSTDAFEAFLAKIYVDPDARARFKAHAYEEARRAGLSPEECAAAEKIDWVGLELAARSFANKRKNKVRFTRPALLSRASSIFLQGVSKFRRTVLNRS